MKPIVTISIGILLSSMFAIDSMANEFAGIDDVTMQVIGADEMPDDVFEVIPFPRRRSQVIKKTPQRGFSQQQTETINKPQMGNSIPEPATTPFFNGNSVAEPGVIEPLPNGQFFIPDDYDNLPTGEGTIPPGEPFPPDVIIGADGYLPPPPNVDNIDYGAPGVLPPADINPVTGIPIELDPHLIQPPPDTSITTEPIPAINPDGSIAPGN